MSDIKISIKNIIKTKKAEIDGHVYTVRKMGAGEQMDLLAMGRKLQGLSLSDQTPELEKLEQIETIRQQMLEIYKSLFDDGLGGEKTKELINTLSDEEISELVNTIFKD